MSAPKVPVACLMVEGGYARIIPHRKLSSLQESGGAQCQQRRSTELSELGEVSKLQKICWVVPIGEAAYSKDFSKIIVYVNNFIIRRLNSPFCAGAGGALHLLSTCVARRDIQKVSNQPVKVDLNRGATRHQAARCFKRQTAHGFG